MDTATETRNHREPWNKGKLVGQKAPFKLKDIWALRVRLQMEGRRVRELALLNLGIQEQTRQCLTNIADILEAAGSSMDNPVSVTIVIADEEEFAGMNEEWMRWFPSHPPARQGAKLLARIPGLKDSIAAIAEA